MIFFIIFRNLVYDGFPKAFRIAIKLVPVDEVSTVATDEYKASSSHFGQRVTVYNSLGHQHI